LEEIIYKKEFSRLKDDLDEYEYEAIMIKEF